MLDGAGARVIGLDFLFDQATEPNKDRQLIAAIRKASDKVVIGTIDQRMALREERRAYMRRFVQDAGVSVGYLNLRIEIDRVVRGEADPLPAGTGAGGVQDSFAMAVARKAGVQNVVLAPRIAWLRAPRDGTDTFNILPAAQIVAPASEDERKMAQMLLAGLKDRVVLIGGDLSDQADRHATPLAKLGEGGAPGVIVHAQAVAQKLDGRQLGLLDLTWERLLVLAMSLVGFLVGWRFRATHWVTSTLPIIVLGLIDAIFFAGLRTIVPFAAPAIAWVLAVWCGRGVRLVTLKLAL